MMGFAGCGEAERLPSSDGAATQQRPAGNGHVVQLEPLAQPHELQWLDQYYLDPQLDRIETLLTLEKVRDFAEDPGAAAALVGFASRVFAANPDRLEEWFPADDRVFEDERSLYYRALWESATAEADAILNDVRDRATEDVQLHVIGMQMQTRLPILEQPVEAAWQVDKLWGAFSATGDARYVEVIIAVAEWTPSVNEFESAAIQSAAAWSLGMKAELHELVYRTCRRYVEEADEPGRDLQNVVRNASRHWSSR